MTQWKPNEKPDWRLARLNCMASCGAAFATVMWVSYGLRPYSGWADRIDPLGVTLLPVLGILLTVVLIITTGSFFLSGLRIFMEAQLEP